MKLSKNESSSGKVKRIGAYAYERAAENDGTRELPWHKNQSAIVVAKAAEAALVRGENIEQFIRRHLTVDPLDFMLRTKVNRTDWVFLETPVVWGGAVIATDRKEMQRVTRYFVSNTGGYLFKEMLPTDDQKKEWLIKPHWRHKVSGKTQQANKAPSGMWVQCAPVSAEPPVRRIGIEAGFTVTPCNSLVGLDMSNVNISYYVAEARKLVDKLLTSGDHDSVRAA